MQHWMWIGATNLFRAAVAGNGEKVHGNVHYNADTNDWSWYITRYTTTEALRVGYGSYRSATKCVAAIEEYIGAQQ